MAKTTRTPKPAPMTPTGLAAAIDALSQLTARHQRLQLIATIGRMGGKVYDTMGPAGWKMVLGGITATATDGLHGAVTNWCNAARRVIARFEP